MWRPWRSDERQEEVAETVCRVCGWDDGDEFYDQTGAPTYAICDCCGAESGVDDLAPKDVRRYREQWIAKGASWFSARERPDGWNIAAQLGRVPERYR